MASAYAQGGMRCAQGSPYYWERSWDFAYNSGNSTFTPQGMPATSMDWQLGSLAVTEQAGSTTFEAPTSSGLQTWITTSGGALTGTGFHAGTAESHVRCGTSLDGVAQAGAVQVPMRCTVVDPSSGDSSSYDLSFSVNASRYPYATIAVVGGGGGGQLVDDPTGDLLATGGVELDPATASPSAARFILAANTNRQTVYQLYEGRLVTVNVGIAGQSLLQTCNAN